MSRKASGDIFSDFAGPITTNAHDRDGSNFDKITVAGKTIVMDQKATPSNNGPSERTESVMHDILYGGTFDPDADGNYGMYAVAGTYVDPFGGGIKRMKESKKRATSYARYGWIAQGNVNTDSHEMKMFYQGIPTETEKMPTTGKATYLGHAMARHSGSEMSTHFSKEYTNFNPSHGKEMAFIMVLPNLLLILVTKLWKVRFLTGMMVKVKQYLGLIQSNLMRRFKPILLKVKLLLK